MKKILASTIIFVLAIFTFNLSYATKESKESDIKLSLTGKTIVEEGTQNLTINLFMGEFQNIPKNPIIGYQAKLEFDSQVFDLIEVTGTDEWFVAYEKDNGNIVGESVSIATEKKEIASFNFKIKSDVKPTSANITLKNITLIVQDLSGEADNITLNKEEKVDVTITAKENKNQNSQEKTQKNVVPAEQETQLLEQQADAEVDATTLVQAKKDDEMQDNEQQDAIKKEKNKDKTTISKIIPKTGIGKIAVFVITIIIIGTICLIRYKIIEINLRN